MKLSSVKTLYRGDIVVQGVEMKDADGELHQFDRVRKGTTVVAICHDVVNGHVVMVERYKVGAMNNLLDFPIGRQCDDEDHLQAVNRIVKFETGCEVKSAQLLQEYMGNPEVDFNPTLVFYCTVDSREAVDCTVKPAKQLMREVSECEYESVHVVLGAWYLKMLNKGLEK